MLLSNECYLKGRCYKHLSNISTKHKICEKPKKDTRTGLEVRFDATDMTELTKHLEDVDLECNASAHFCPKLFKVDYLYNEALLSPKQKHHVELWLDITQADKQAYTQLATIESNIEQFVNGGNNLFIYSATTGNGKTEWALRLLRGYINRIWHKSDLRCRALFVNVPRFLLAVKHSISETDEYAEHIMKNILSADLVVFDEVATKSLTVFEHEHILSLINARIDMGKSNIYTSNLFNEELRNRIGDRLYSRIVTASTKVELVEPDKRGMMVTK